MLIDATIAGREKVEVNPTTILSRAIQGDKGILLTESNCACSESSRDLIRTSENPPILSQVTSICYRVNSGLQNIEFNLMIGNDEIKCALSHTFIPCLHRLHRLSVDK